MISNLPSSEFPTVWWSNNGKHVVMDLNKLTSRRYTTAGNETQKLWRSFQVLCFCENRLLCESFHTCHPKKYTALSLPETKIS